MDLSKRKAGILTSNLTYFVFANIVLFSFGFVKIPVLTNIFEPADLGKYTLYVTILSYVDVLLLSWASSTFWRYIYEKETAHSFLKILSTVLPFFLLASLLAGLVLTVTPLLISKTYITVELLLTGYLMIICQQLVSFYFLYLQSQKKIQQWCVVVSLQQMISFLLLIYFTSVVKVGIAGIFYSSLLYNLFFLFFLVVKYRQKILRFTLKIDTAFYRKIFTYSSIAIFINTCLILLNNGDRILISYFKGSEELGLYAQSYGLASVGLYTVIQAFNMMTAPSYNAALLKEQLVKINIRVIQIYVLLFTPVLVFIILNAKNITQILLAAPYHGYHNIFSWVSLGIYCYGLCHFLEVRLKFLNKAKIVLSILAIVVVFNFILNAVLLKSNSINVAAVVTFISYLLLLVLLAFLNKYFFQQLRLTGFIKDLFFSSLMFAIIHYISLNILNKLPLLNLGIDFIVAAVVFYFYLRKYSPLLLFFYKKIV